LNVNSASPYADALTKSAGRPFRRDVWTKTPSPGDVIIAPGLDKRTVTWPTVSQPWAGIVKTWACTFTARHHSKVVWAINAIDFENFANKIMNRFCFCILKFGR